MISNININIYTYCSYSIESLLYILLKVFHAAYILPSARIIILVIQPHPISSQFIVVVFIGGSHNQPWVINLGQPLDQKYVPLVQL